MSNTFLVAKKIHRFLVLIITGLGLLQLGTGLILKYPGKAIDLFPSLDVVSVRTLHNTMSTYFGIVFFIMMLAGLWMYFYTMLKKRQRPSPPDTKE